MMHANNTVNPSQVKSIDTSLSKALSQKSFEKYPTSLDQIQKDAKGELKKTLGRNQSQNFFKTQTNPKSLAKQSFLYTSDDFRSN
jgi:hypothetical protein